MNHYEHRHALAVELARYLRKLPICPLQRDLASLGVRRNLCVSIGPRVRRAARHG